MIDNFFFFWRKDLWLIIGSGKVSIYCILPQPTILQFITTCFLVINNSNSQIIPFSFYQFVYIYIYKILKLQKHRSPKLWLAKKKKMIILGYFDFTITYWLRYLNKMSKNIVVQDKFYQLSAGKDNKATLSKILDLRGLGFKS